MFKTKKLIVFFVAALMVTAGCQSTDVRKAAEPPKSSKPADVEKVTKAKKVSKPAEATKVKEVGKAKKDVKAKKAVEAKKVSKTAKVKKAAKVKEAEKVSTPKLAPAKNQPTNYNKDNEPKYSNKFLIGLGFFSPMQFPCEKTVVSGFRFSAIYAYNQAANGLDCGFICDSGTGGTKGIQAGVIANRTAGPMTGLSLSLINIAETEMNGIQIGGLFNEAGSNSQNNAAANYETSCGIQFGTANVANSIFKGLQLGVFNISNAIFKGCQIGLLNLYEPPSDVFDDFQTAEFNKEKKERSCIQFGILNFNPNGIFPVTMLVNW